MEGGGVARAFGLNRFLRFESGMENFGVLGMENFDTPTIAGRFFILEAFLHTLAWSLSARRI